MAAAVARIEKKTEGAGEEEGGTRASTEKKTPQQRSLAAVEGAAKSALNGNKTLAAVAVVAATEIAATPVVAAEMILSAGEAEATLESTILPAMRTKQPEGAGVVVAETTAQKTEEAPAVKEAVIRKTLAGAAGVAEGEAVA